LGAFGLGTESGGGKEEPSASLLHIEKRAARRVSRVGKRRRVNGPSASPAVSTMKSWSFVCAAIDELFRESAQGRASADTLFPTTAAQAATEHTHPTWRSSARTSSRPVVMSVMSIALRHDAFFLPASFLAALGAPVVEGGMLKEGGRG